MLRYLRKGPSSETTTKRNSLDSVKTSSAGSRNVFDRGEAGTRRQSSDNTEYSKPLEETKNDGKDEVVGTNAQSAGIADQLLKSGNDDAVGGAVKEAAAGERPTEHLKVLGKFDVDSIKTEYPGLYFKLMVWVYDLYNAFDANRNPNFLDVSRLPKDKSHPLWSAERLRGFNTDMVISLFPSTYFTTSDWTTFSKLRFIWIGGEDGRESAFSEVFDILLQEHKDSTTPGLLAIQSWHNCLAKSLFFARLCLAPFTARAFDIKFDDLSDSRVFMKAINVNEHSCLVPPSPSQFFEEYNAELESKHEKARTRLTRARLDLEDFQSQEKRYFEANVPETDLRRAEEDTCRQWYVIEDMKQKLQYMGIDFNNQGPEVVFQKDNKEKLEANHPGVLKEARDQEMLALTASTPSLPPLDDDDMATRGSSTTPRTSVDIDEGQTTNLSTFGQTWHNTWSRFTRTKRSAGTAEDEGTLRRETGEKTLGKRKSVTNFFRQLTQ